MTTSWQYEMRQRIAESEAMPENVDLSVKRAVVRSCSYSTAKKIIETYEWLGNLSAINQFYFGIYFQAKSKEGIPSKGLFPNSEVCGGAVVFGPDYGENLKIWDKYGFTGKIILLNRGACCYWTPKNTASKLITQAIKKLPPKYEIVTCTVDSRAGEVGTIYQACNFIYVGAMGGRHIAIIHKGKMISDRSINRRGGKQKVLRTLNGAEVVLQSVKARYFYFRKNEKRHKVAIEQLIKPYPKRET